MRDDRLPAELLNRLSEAAQQALREGTRGQRTGLLAAGLGLSEAQALATLARLVNLPVLENPAADLAALRLLPARLAEEFQVIPVLPPGGASAALTLATPWPPDEILADWIATFTPRPIAWHLAPADRIRELIQTNYGIGSGSLDEDPAGLTPAAGHSEPEADADAAVVRFVADVIDQAVAQDATDIHFEPQDGALAIRYRIDGLLVPVPLPENLLRFQDAIISRLKIMARLNISERRLPQDGRIDFRRNGTSLDIRVSTIPTIYAESVSLRLLNQRKTSYSLDDLGLSPAEQALIARVLDYPHGLILVTGPTGSGKSTSLNAFLRRINGPELRIITVEDPIEYELPGANQMQVHPEIGLTFASALRHVLRQDPDVVMIGEIRDRDTAAIAIRASLTGHLVLSTLHTNDAAGALTRLTDMGIEPFLVASAVELVIAQRLVRRLCPACARREPVDAAALQAALATLQLPATEAAGLTELPAAGGCRACRQTGFRGRIGVFEILSPKPLHDLILRRESTKALAALARTQGMRTLQQSGWERVKAGQTTLAELLRAIGTTGD
jgi:type II secretory ATPase GspE/PulE/Tfp pilus assembly ATPase PilB-like protein